MNTITIIPRQGEDVYSLLVKKELALRKANRGTLHRSGPKRKDKDKWVHASYKGWIQFQRSVGGVVVAVVNSRDPDSQWQLLSSFLGFLHRHFDASIMTVTVTFGGAEASE